MLNSNGDSIDSNNLPDVAAARAKAGKMPMAIAVLDACDSLDNAKTNWSGVAGSVLGYHGPMNLNYKAIGGDREDRVNTVKFTPPIQVTHRKKGKKN